MIHLRKFATGVAIEIDRPKSLGALDTECFDRIEEALEEARQCSNVAWVAFFSRLPRGFCAGGDVRKLHDDYKKSKSFEAAERFFSTEYRVDQKVWNFPKPVIALTHGITMGGGIGLIRGASHRVVAPDSILAMPEISIGLYPDVGATYFLQQIPQPERSLVAYCAARFGPAEALRWNVATHCVAESAHGQGHLLLPALDTLEWHGNSKDLDTVSHWLNRYSMRPPPQWEAVSPEIEALFNRTTAQEIFEQASHLNFPILEPVKNGSPLSACVIHEQLSRASSLTLAEAFDWEFHLSMGCLRWGDFFEGVRARLIERSSGGLASWKYSSPEKVPQSILDSIMNQGTSSGSLQNNIKSRVIQLLKAHFEPIAHSENSSEAAQAKRALLMYRFLPVRVPEPPGLIEPGSLALIEILVKTGASPKSWVFMVPGHGGLVTDFEGLPLQVITPQSPLGEALLGKTTGQVAQVATHTGALRSYRVLEVL